MRVVAMRFQNNLAEMSLDDPLHKYVKLYTYTTKRTCQKGSLSVPPHITI